MKIKRYDKSNKIEEEMGFEFDKLELIGYVEMCFDVIWSSISSSLSTKSKSL